jgi:acetyl esterase/lipase
MSRGKKWLWRLSLLGFVALVTMGLWLPPIITHAVEKDYHFPEVEIDATVLPNGDMVLEETRTFDFRNGPFTYAYFNVDDPLDHVRDFSIAEKLDDGSEVAVTPDYASHSIVTDGFQAQWSLIQGAEDRCTPVGQGCELASAIAASGTEVELVVYPREGHVPMERAHALDAIRRTQAWFDRHLRSVD